MQYQCTEYDTILIKRKAVFKNILHDIRVRRGQVVNVAKWK